LCKDHQCTQIESLKVWGSVIVELSVTGQIPSTSEGILGLNFLETNKCVLNLTMGELLTQGKTLSQHIKEPSLQSQVEITAQKTFTIAVASEI